MAETQTQQSGGQKPLDDLTYDLITVIHEKSKGLEAYDKYMQDAQSDEQASSLFEEIRQNDAQAVERLKSELARVMGGGSQG